VNLSRGSRIFDYLLEHELGTGGMGVVWGARDVTTGKQVALKVLRAAEHAPEARERLLREALATRSIAHPAVVPVSEILDFEGSPVLVMELLRGETLRSVLEREARLPLGRIAALLVPVCEALAEAHAAGIVHRDLKPENVFLEAAGNVRLLDFGVARFHSPPEGTLEPLTALGALVGTIQYMAPEQALRPSESDQLVDVWAVGVMLFEALSGCRPIEGATPNAALRQLLIAAITPIEVMVPELPREVAALIGKMLSRSREDRPASLAEVATVLQRYRNES
jgi:eukaryotic-like serine/threonine-protein kinase